MMTRTVLFRFLIFSLAGCSVVACNKSDKPVNETRRKASITPVIGCDNPERKADVIFIHGVDGDHLSTWHPTGDDQAYWPRWLGEEMHEIGVWSIDYPAATKIGGDGTMALTTRADNLLSLLDSKGFDDDSKRPIVFVMHSFGGVVTKQMIRSAAESPRDEWQAIGRRINGAVFIAVPNSGSGIASFLTHIAPKFTTVTLEDLRKDEPNLEDLNRWFRDNAKRRGIETMAFFETQKTSGIQVVTLSSADPGIEGTEIVGLDDDHISICKLPDSDSQLFDLTREFVTKRIQRGPPPPPFPMPTGDFVISKQDHDDTVPTADAESVMLTLKNRSGLKLWIILFDWSRYYGHPDFVESRPLRYAHTSCWREFEVDQNGEIVFEDFEPGNGNFSIVLRFPDQSYSSYLGAENIFSSAEPTITIKKVGNRYEAEVR